MTTPEESLRRRLRGPATVVFEGFYEAHSPTWRAYALHLTASQEAAEEITDAVTTRLWCTWHHALNLSSPEDYAWRLLRAELDDFFRAHDISPMFAATATFARLSQPPALFDDLRDAFRNLEQSIGVYAAIAELPDRQFDITVLRYVIELTDEEVAHILGCAPATVRSQLRNARRKLEARLFGPKTKDEE